MTLSKVFRTQEGVSRSLSGSSTTKPAHWTKKVQKQPQKWLSALAGGPTAITLVINHSIFIKWSWVMFLGLISWYSFHITKLLPALKNYPTCWKYIQTRPKKSRSDLAVDPTAVASIINHSIFITKLWPNIRSISVDRMQDLILFLS